MKNFLYMTKEQLIEQLWSTEPKIRQILKNSKHVEEARHVIFDYLNRLDRDLYNMKSDTYFVNLNIIEKRNAKECIRVLMNTMRSENEYLTKVCPLEALYDIVH
jgi:lysine 2,3-aminomutase